VRLREVDFRDPWDFEEVYGAARLARTYPFTRSDEEYLVHITTGTHVRRSAVPAHRVAAFPGEAAADLAPPAARHREEGARGHLPHHRPRPLALRPPRQALRREQRESLAFLKSGIATRNAATSTASSSASSSWPRAPERRSCSRAPRARASLSSAARIYELRKPRGLVKGELVEVNCATLRGDGAMSALFGHVKGAFTGAASDRKGLLRKADGGVLFLDEIGELGLDEQAMLLRAIEEEVFCPWAATARCARSFSSSPAPTATSRRDVAAGRFREDLLARIHLWTFRLPGLRERSEDIEPNLDYELDRARRRLGTRVTMSREARERFLAFAAPPRRALARELPRPQRGRAAHEHAGLGRTHRRFPCG
jgi:transcriptional regulatory protein RtcR